MEQLNSYLPLLSYLKDFEHATSVTARMHISFPEHELTIILPWCMPRNYVDQYWLMPSFIPTQLVTLNAHPEAINHVVDDSKLRKHQGDTNMTSGRPGKKQHTPTNNGKNPSDKNSEHKSDRFWQRCHEHGDAKTTYNTYDCRKDDAKGTLLRSFGKSSKKAIDDCQKKYHGKFDSHSFTQAVSEKNRKVGWESLWKARVSKRKKHRRRHSGDSVSTYGSCSA